MKKIYKFLCAVTIGAGSLIPALAQVAVQNKINQASPPQHAKLQPTGTPIAPKISNAATTSATTESVWLNDLIANEYVLTSGQSPLVGGSGSQLAAIGISYIFPDSVGLFQYSSGPNSESFIHLLGNIFDPLAQNIQSYKSAAYPSTNPWDQFNDYTVDSIRLPFNYNRNNTAGDMNNADTLLIYLYNDSDGLDAFKVWPQEVFASPNLVESNFGLADTTHDTLVWKDQLYALPDTNSPRFANGAPMVLGVNLFKIPLTIADTNNVGQFFTFATNHFHVPAGKQVCAAFEFKPGYAYSGSDVINVDKNDFSFWYAEMNGVGTYPYYFGTGGLNDSYDGSGAYDKDWNMTSTITTYEQRGPGHGDLWGDNRIFVPVYNWLAAWSVEELYVSYLVTSTFTTGIHETASLDGNILYQNIPNPANHGTTLIKYDTKTDGAVELQVTDLTGRIVMELNQGTQSAGSHFVTMDISTLSQGMYLYTLRTNSESLTRRMVVGQ